MKRVPGTDRNEMVIVLGYGLSSEPISFTSSRPGHTRVPTCTQGKGPAKTSVNTESAPLSSELWHHTAYPAQSACSTSMPEATWAQPLSREELS
jgi:hypothetical protein